MKVVCINRGKIKNLTLGKTYSIVRQNSGIHQNSDKEYNNIWVINDSGIEKHYSMKRFVDIVRWRDKVINDILS